MIGRFFYLALLAMLSVNANASIQNSIDASHSSDSITLESIFNDGDETSFLFLAINEMTPPEILEKLVNSSSDILSSGARNNPSYIKYINQLKFLPFTKKFDEASSILIDLISVNANEKDQEMIEKNNDIIFQKINEDLPKFIRLNNMFINRYIVQLNLSKSIFKIMYYNNVEQNDLSTYEHMAKNAETPEEILEKLSIHKNVFVKRFAKQNLVGSRLRKASDFPDLD